MPAFISSTSASFLVAAPAIAFARSDSSDALFFSASSAGTIALTSSIFCSTSFCFSITSSCRMPTDSCVVLSFSTPLT